MVFGFLKNKKHNREMFLKEIMETTSRFVVAALPNMTQFNNDDIKILAYGFLTAPIDELSNEHHIRNADKVMLYAAIMQILNIDMGDDMAFGSAQALITWKNQMNLSDKYDYMGQCSMLGMEAFELWRKHDEDSLAKVFVNLDTILSRLNSLSKDMNYLINGQ